MNGNNGNISRTAAIVIAMIMIAMTAFSSVSGATTSEERTEVVQLQMMQELNEELAKAVLPENTVRNNMDGRKGDSRTEIREMGIKNSGMSSASFIPSYPRVIDYCRVGLVFDDIAKYIITIQFEPGENNTKILPGYVRETGLICTEADELLLILPGQSLTEHFYADSDSPESMAIYFAQEGYNVVVLNRRESSVQMGEANSSDMKNWTIEDYLNDMYYDIIISRLHTGLLNRRGMSNVRVYAIGHSIGAALLVDYEANGYDNRWFGDLDKIIPVDIITKYNPAYPELIQDQKYRYDNVTSDIEGGKYCNDDMAGMIGLAQLAFGFPNGTDVHPELTNIQMFRMMASQTYLFEDYPFTPDYHYWTGDIGGLRYIDEQRILLATITGGAVPYSPLILDQRIAGLMGNVDGCDIDPSEIDLPALYIGLGGGCSYYGAWWWIEEVGKTNDNVTTLNWRNQGHASLVMDYNSPELWNIMDFWLRMP